MRNLKAVLGIVLLFLCVNVFAVTKVNVPVRMVSDYVASGDDFTYRAYVYYLEDPKYGGYYFTSSVVNLKTISCIPTEKKNFKCHSSGYRFSTPLAALQDDLDDWNSENSNSGINHVCKIDKQRLIVECNYSDGSNGSGTGGSDGSGTDSSPNDTNPTNPNSNLCGRTIGGVWVSMPCDGSGNNSDGSGGSSGGSGSDGSGGSSGGSGSDGSGTGGSNGSGADGSGDSSGGAGDSGNGSDGSGNTDYIPPDERDCSPFDPSKNMCGGNSIVGHAPKNGFLIYSCRREKANGQYEYYNFWSVSATISNNILYCDGSAYVSSKDDKGNTYITIYNNYGSADDALNGSKFDDGRNDIYDVFDRDRDNKNNANNGSSGSDGSTSGSASSPSSGSSGSSNSGSDGSVSSVGSASGVGQCEEGEDILGCVPVGSSADVDAAIDGSIGGLGESDFGIGKGEVNINTFSKGSDFVESGTCPPPKTITILKSTHEISYQPMCDFAIGIRPIVIFLAMFAAFMIVRAAILAKD